MTAAAQQRAEQLGMKSKLAIHFGGKCSVKRKFFSKKGDLEDRWAEGKYMGLSPSVNDGHIVLRSDGVGNGFVQTLHVRTRLVSPEPPPLQFVGDSLEEEHTPPPRRGVVSGPLVRDLTSCFLQTHRHPCRRQQELHKGACATCWGGVGPCSAFEFAIP